MSVYNVRGLNSIQQACKVVQALEDPLAGQTTSVLHRICAAQGTAHKLCIYFSHWNRRQSSE